MDTSALKHHLHPPIDFDQFVKAGGMHLGVGDPDGVFVGTSWMLCRRCDRVHLVDAGFFHKKQALELVEHTFVASSDDGLSEWLREHGDSGEYEQPPAPTPEELEHLQQILRNLLENL